MKDKEKKRFSDIFPNADPLAIDLLEMLLQFSPEKRISAEDALRHEYFREGQEEIVNEVGSFIRSLLILFLIPLPLPLPPPPPPQSSKPSATSNFDFSFEQQAETRHFKEMIYDEIREWNKAQVYQIRKLLQNPPSPGELSRKSSVLGLIQNAINNNQTEKHNWVQDEPFAEAL